MIGAIWSNQANFTCPNSIIYSIIFRYVILLTKLLLITDSLAFNGQDDTINLRESSTQIVVSFAFFIVCLQYLSNFQGF